MKESNGETGVATTPLPEYSKEFTLQFPYTLATGERLERVTLRRPKVRDLKVAQKRADNAVDIEIILISLVCQPALTPEDLDDLDAKDYADLQGFFR